MSSDISDPQPLTPSDLLYGRIVSLPHELVVDQLEDQIMAMLLKLNGALRPKLILSETFKLDGDTNT